MVIYCNIQMGKYLMCYGVMQIIFNRRNFFNELRVCREYIASHLIKLRVVIKKYLNLTTKLYQKNPWNLVDQR